MGNNFNKVFYDHRPINPTVTLEELKHREIRMEFGNPPSICEVANAI